MSFISSAEAHLGLIYFGILLILLVRAALHLGKDVLHHLLEGWLIGILGVGAFAAKLVKPVATIAGKTTSVDLPKGFRVGIASTEGAHKVTSAATVTSASVISPAVTLILLVLLLIIGLIVTSKVTRTRRRKEAAAARAAAEQQQPPFGPYGPGGPR